MLQTLDVLIGVAVVMLTVSMAVTAWTQMWVYALNSRGKYLRGGIADILGQLAPTLSSDDANTVADTILKHPLICNNPKRLGEVIQREELTKLLLELVSGDGPQQLSATLRENLSDALAAGGIQDPAQVLDNVRSLLIHLELSNPEMSSSSRATVAFLKEANSRFLGKLNAWFDPVMDRVTDRFTVHARKLTIGGAFLVALLLQLDTIALVNKLSVDPELRRTLVEHAYHLENKRPTGTLTEDQKVQLREFERLGILTLENPLNLLDLDVLMPKLFGILLSGILLSLGAPFWYKVLRGLLRLRSVLAQKEDDQRAERQQTQASAAKTTTATGPPSLVGERGILG